MAPDWIPKIHPFVVHFPVALLVIAILTDFARIIILKADWIDKTILFLYAAGTLGLSAAYLTGQQAVDSVSVTGDATAAVASHEDWAFYTFLFFILFTIFRGIGLRDPFLRLQKRTNGDSYPW